MARDGIIFCGRYLDILWNQNFPETAKSLRLLMTNRSVIRISIPVVGLLYAVSPQTIHACSVCVGNPSDPMTEGLSLAILSLLGVTGTVLASFGAFFIYLMKKARRINEKTKSSETGRNGRAYL